MGELIYSGLEEGRDRTARYKAIRSGNRVQWSRVIGDSLHQR